jgi:hypothetical protein
MVIPALAEEWDWPRMMNKVCPVPIELSLTIE